MKKANKIMIIGCPGSGKSTLAVNLNKILSFPVYHLDSLFNKQNWIRATKEEWTTKINDIIVRDEWIMDGTYGETLEMRAEQADAIIWLNYPTLTCLRRIFKRYDENKGKGRVNIAEGCNEKIDIDFVRNVLKFKEEHRDVFLAFRKRLQNKEFIMLKNDNQVKNFLEKVSEEGGVYF